MRPTLREYFARLKAHDWHWRMSDDSRTYNKGMSEEMRLLSWAELSGGHARCWKAWSEHVAAPDIYDRPTEELFDFEDAI